MRSTKLKPTDIVGKYYTWSEKHFYLVLEADNRSDKVLLHRTTKVLLPRTTSYRLGNKEAHCGGRKCKWYRLCHNKAHLYCYSLTVVLNHIERGNLIEVPQVEGILECGLKEQIMGG